MFSHVFSIKYVWYHNGMMYGFEQGGWFDILIGMQCSCTQRLAWAAGEQTAGNQGTAETTAGEGDSNPGENHDHSGSGEGGKNYHITCFNFSMSAKCFVFFFFWSKMNIIFFFFFCSF